MVSTSVIVRQDKILVDAKELNITLESVYIDPSDTTKGRTFKIPAEAKDGGSLINDLFAALNEISDDKQKVIDKMKEKMGANTDEKDLPKMGQLLLQIDKEIPFQIVKEVMYTAGQAKFNEYQFVVIGPME